MTDTIKSLPIYSHLDHITNTFIQKGLLLLSAAPGAGKTTLLPWALLSRPEFQDKKIILLEPRRLAARAAANRISHLLGEKPGQTVGLRTRLETLVSSNTRLEVITEGVLIPMLQHNHHLDGYGALLFDEFHTRSLHGDLGLSLAWATRQQQRPDLAIALLSATLPSQELLTVFPDFPLLEVQAPSHPVEVTYRPPLSPQEKPWQGAARLCLEALQNLKAPAQATVLCFLPGYL